MNDRSAETPRPLPARLRSYLSAPELADVWTAARNRLERNGLRVATTISLDLNDLAADRLSGLLGRDLPAGSGRKLKLAEIDTALRRSSAGQGLISVIESLDGRPLVDRAAAREDEQAQWARIWRGLDASLAEAGLAEAEWVPDWINDLRHTGILTRAGTDGAARALDHAVTTLGLLAGSSAPHLLQPVTHNTDVNLPSWELGALASHTTGDSHGLDDTRLSTAVLLRAAARALGVSVPESASGRRELWYALGVTTDSISGTVLVWNLRPPGSDRWSAMLRERADLGLVTHLTVHELDRAEGVVFAEPDQTVYVCENPQVLQAAAHAAAEQPMLCLSGNPSTAGTRLLRTLISAGNPIRYHGDFDWPGIAMTGRVVAMGATAWRMSAADYRRAVAVLDNDHAVLLAGKPVPTPWDPALAPAMSARGLVVYEESVLADLIAELS